MSEKRIEPCPACREDGSDKSGKHLAIFPSGKFACAVHPGDKTHNRRIVELRPDLGKDDAFPPAEPKRPISNPRASKNGKPGKIVAVYPYHDANGKLVYEIRRDESKAFWPYLPDATKSELPATIVRVPYRLPEVLKAETVWIVEGEKDADNLAALGYTATTRAGGSGKWDGELTPWFAGKDIILCGDNDADEKGRKYMDKVEAALSPFAKSVRRVLVPSPAKDISDYMAEMSEGEAFTAVQGLLSVPDPLDALLDARRLNLANPPAKPVPVLLITEKPICTAGNLTVIQAIAKAGKTSFEAGCIASLMNPTGDCLGVTGQNPDGLAVIHFDTEQSEYDHFAIIGKQVLARAGLSDLPEWLRSYHLADVPTPLRRKALAHEMKRAAIGGKLLAVFVDGIADLCIDPNDNAEAFGLVEELHRLAITYHCPIICVLHENPGSTEGKTRGHLGSQLERKAETNLRLSKANDGITTIFTERSRHCHIPKEAGPRFQWDDVAQMHLSCGTTHAERNDAKTQDMQRIFGDLFTQKSGYRHSELVTAYVEHEGVCERTAKARIKDAAASGIVTHSAAMRLYSRGTL